VLPVTPVIDDEPPPKIEPTPAPAVSVPVS